VRVDLRSSLQEDERLKCLAGEGESEPLVHSPPPCGLSSHEDLAFLCVFVVRVLT